MRACLKIITLALLPAIFAGCMFSLPGSGGTTPNPSGGTLAEHVLGQVLVRPCEGADANAIAGALGGSVLRNLDGLVRIKLAAGTDLNAAIAALGRRADVVYAEPVYIYHTPVIGTARETALRDAVDYYASQWGPRQIGAEGIWTQSPDCSGVTVGLVDTGIDRDNPELASRVTAGTNRLFAEDPSDYEDDEGHGTHVAGIIGAAHGDGGINGLAGDVRFVVAKVLGPAGGTNDEVAAGIRWAADRAQVINMSLGGWGRSQAIQDAVDYAVYTKHVVVIAAAGNEYRTGITHYPAACEGVIAVGASNPDGTKADFSNEGPYLSVAAPGVDILSTIPGPSYATWSGTSMAAPHVTGLVALLLTKTTSPTMIRTLLERYTAGSTHAWNKALGWGVIDALAAYNNADGVGEVNEYGGLQVTVTGAAVGNAEVLIRRAADNSLVTANRTNGDGIAYFHFLRAGSYKIYVTKKVSATSTLSGYRDAVGVSAGDTPGAVTIPVS